MCLAGVLALVALAPGAASVAHAEAAPRGAYRAETLRAVFLLNFIRFTEWPPVTLSDDSPYIVGIAGSRALEDELIELTDKQRVRERRVHVVRIKSLHDLEGCHLLYVSPFAAPGEEPAPGVAELLPKTRGKPLLTVSESPDFLARGGVVNFYAGEGGQLRFEISLEAAQAAGLQISSRLLALARAAPGAEKKPPQPAPP